MTTPAAFEGRRRTHKDGATVTPVMLTRFESELCVKRSWRKWRRATSTRRRWTSCRRAPTPRSLSPAPSRDPRARNVVERLVSRVRASVLCLVGPDSTTSPFVPRTARPGSPTSSRSCAARSRPAAASMPSSSSSTRQRPVLSAAASVAPDAVADCPRLLLAIRGLTGACPSSSGAASCLRLTRVAPLAPYERVGPYLEQLMVPVSCQNLYLFV